MASTGHDRITLEESREYINEMFENNLMVRSGPVLSPPRSQDLDHMEQLHW